jgi:hypothetical protein
MKKLIPVLLLLMALSSCKKTEFSPVGPTDVAIRNLSDQTLNELTVKIKSQIHTYGNIGPSQVSDYFRFDTAFVKAEITAKVNGVNFSTATVNYLGLIHIGRERIIYNVWLPNGLSEPVIEIDDVVYIEPLILGD